MTVTTTVFNGTETENFVDQMQKGELSWTEGRLMQHVAEIVMLILAAVVLVILLCICLRNRRRRALKRTIPSILLDHEKTTPFLANEDPRYDPPPEYEPTPPAYHHVPTAPPL